jgi:hypothetical protein
MRLVSCQRCREREEIPTHQYVKFDGEVRYVCRRCWAGFRRWFHHGARLAEPDAGSS